MTPTCACGSTQNTHPSLTFSSCHSPPTLNTSSGLICLLLRSTLIHHNASTSQWRPSPKLLTTPDTLPPQPHLITPPLLYNVPDTQPATSNNSTSLWNDQNINRDLEYLHHKLPAAYYTWLLQYIDAYMENFCTLAQSSTAIRVQAYQHILHCIDFVFFPGKEIDGVWHNTNRIKNQFHKDSVWTIWKNMLCWIVDSLCPILSLPTSCLERVNVLTPTPPTPQLQISNVKVDMKS